MTNDFFAELARCLHKKEIDSVIQKDRRLEVILHGQPALFVTPRNEVFLLPEMSGSEEANDLYHPVMNDSPIAGCLLNYLRELALGLGTHRIDFDLIGVLRIGSYWRWLIGVCI